MNDQGLVIRELERAAMDGECVVLASIVRTEGSAYRGVGTRMIVRADDSPAGLVSGGCLESDLVERARDVRERNTAQIVTYDSRSDDDLVWGLGLGCDGMVQVLVEPLSGEHAMRLAALLQMARERDDRAILATVIGDDASVGARMLMTDDGSELCRTGDWSDENTLTAVFASTSSGIIAGRRGAICNAQGVDIALELIVPQPDLVICGSGPDAVPLAEFGAGQGWNVMIVDHRPIDLAHPERFPSALVVECGSPEHLADTVTLSDRSAIVVMSHNYARDIEYMNAALQSPAPYVGMLGPRRRTERMFDDLNARGEPVEDAALARLHAPIGLDIGGDSPEAIALSITAEISAVMNARNGGMLRDRRAPIHDSLAVPSLL
jgi:xanthine dehydrogenase accessory factor